MEETKTIYWKHISRNYLNPGYKTDLFTKPVQDLKQDGKNKKDFERSEMGSWRGVERGVPGFKGETQNVDLTDKVRANHYLRHLIIVLYYMSCTGPDLPILSITLHRPDLPILSITHHRHPCHTWRVELPRRIRLIELRVLRVSLSGKRKKKNLFSKFC
jgi:hypothetical protein